jgi:hypothetical protein
MAVDMAVRWLMTVSRGAQRREEFSKTHSYQQDDDRNTRQVSG